MKSLSLLVVISLLSMGFPNYEVEVAEVDKQRPMEEYMPEYGYTTVEVAVKELEEHFQKELKLPLRIPPLPFTHQFGRFNDSEGTSNDALDIEYINEEKPYIHYKMMIRHMDSKIPIREKRIIETYTLKNGHEATLINVSGRLQAFVFEREGWQYMLSVNSKCADIITPEVFVQIANSIDFPEEKEGLLDK
ncbi:hypothetical protein [Alkalihalobacillus pseudalcaliphilus]|uniref:hypothetical protein n=1 Tax=Alkalihalobacillus pseudalcaliphilus TaxID=79884 RepID=UPI00064E0662|nr:hypothetical protein [Alkalihalobacillus pseudalcaliphilus]KMK75251.1 hypothetical protein AB990_17660 [Alkalihalobacillus pseudalcaliphilus]